MDARTTSRPTAVVGLEVLTIAACTFGIAALAARGAGSLVSARASMAALVGATCGYLLADVATGLVHWFCDRFFEEDTPWVGSLLIRPFRDHHRDPAAMTRHGWLELCGNSALALAPVLAAAWRLLAGVSGGVMAFTHGGLILFALAVLTTNVFHCWAHAAVVARPIAWLQSCGAILSPERHARHHSAGHAGAYCVTSGWANRPMDGLGIFRWLERLLTVAGVPATRHP